MTLNELNLNTIGYIKNLKCSDNVKRRLLDLGLTPGTKIVPVLVSPSGDPTAFEFRGTLIAIREEDTKFIDLK